MWNDDDGYEPYEDDAAEWEKDRLAEDHEEDDLPSDAFEDWRDDEDCFDSDDEDIPF